MAEGEVISQEPEAGNWEDPDNVNVVITVSTGDQEPSAQSDSADTAASSDAPAQTADNSAAAAAGGSMEMYTDSEYSVRIFRRSGSSGTDPECKRNTDSFSCSGRSGNPVPV